MQKILLTALIFVVCTTFLLQKRQAIFFESKVVFTPEQGADPALVNGGPRGWGLGRGVPLPNGHGSGEGLCPLPRNFFEFLSQNGAFLCILQSAAVILGSENAWRRGSVGFLY